MRADLSKTDDAQAKARSARPSRAPATRSRRATSPGKDESAGKDEVTRLELFRLQVALRSFEKRAYDLFLQNLVKGTSHLSLGQEAIAAAFGVAMQPDDMTFATYRGHAHTLARGVPMAPVMAELLGRSNGLLGGKGGSMHLTSIAHHVMGSYAIVGGHLPIAAGAAWSAKHRGTGQVAVCFFGDGTTNIGAFHEALNLAAVWKLPVVYVCENNFYMEYTPISAVTAVGRPAADRASAYGLDPIVVDGNDADAVYEVACAALSRARAGEGPSLIEAETYRHGGHSRADPAKYRPAEEVARWFQRDPVVLYRARLAEAGVEEPTLAAIESEVQDAVDAATEEAKAGLPPGPDALLTNVWSDGGSSWRN
ncbi:MAG: thiamine pyrophosphate-dependent dehydrogenase E1 component subunit alpha [Acidimicrobiales bacterium]